MRKMGHLSSYYVFSLSYGLKMSKIAHFLYSADESKIVTVWEKYLSAPERFYWVLSEKGMVNRLWSYRLWDIEGKNIKKLLSQQKLPKPCIFNSWHLVNGSSESKTPYYFLKERSNIFQVHLNILPKLWLIFCCHQQKLQKKLPFLTF